MSNYNHLQKVYEDIGHPSGYSGIGKLEKYLKNQDEKNISKKRY